MRRRLNAEFKGNTLGTDTMSERTTENHSRGHLAPAATSAVGEIVLCA